MAKKYEILYIVRPDLEEEKEKALVKRFDDILTDNGAEIIESKKWAKRRLAYPIEDFKDGVYYITTLSTDEAKAINEFDRLAKISNDILRHLIVKKEEE